MLGKRLNKNTPLRTSQAWENRVLSDEQISYAALDAYASLLIYEELINNYTVPSTLPASTPPLTPVLLYTANLQKVIAEGVTSQDVNPTTCNGVAVMPLHVVVDIHRVLVPGALISSHNNQSLESFGPLPFSIVCVCNHLRVYSPPPFRPPSTLEQSSNSSETPISHPSSSELMTEPDNETISIGDLMKSDISGPEQEISPPLSQLKMFEFANSQLGLEEQLLGVIESPDEWDNVIHSRVLKDIWHIFHMIYIPATHGLRKQFTRELRDAVFIPDKEDRERIDAWGATQTPRVSYNKLRNASPEWIRKRCRHTVPPPHILYPLVRKVFCTYGPLVDPVTKQHLFSGKAQWQMARNILDLIRKGFMSDLPDVSLYTQVGIDRKTGLPLYRCARGTNATEGGVHTHIRLGG